MNGLQKAPGLALLLLFALSVVWPAQRPDSKKPTPNQADVPNLAVEVDATDAGRLQLEVRARDFKKTLQFDLTSGVLEKAPGIFVPPGTFREFRVIAFDKKGEKLYSGSTTANLNEKFNAPFAIPLMNSSSERLGAVVLGTYRLRIERESPGGEGAPRRMRAQVLDAAGRIVPMKPGDISWAGANGGGYVPCVQDPVGCIELNPQNPGLVSPDAIVACFLDIFCRTSQKPPADGPWVQVAVGDHHTCALAKSGKIFCWGDDQIGQLGIPGNLGCRMATGFPVPCQVVPTEVTCPAGESCRFRSVAAASDHTCAVDNLFHVWCWGDDAYEVTGADLPTSSEHREIMQHGATGSPDTAIEATQVDTNLKHSCAIARLTGRVLCWGSNGALQLGQPAATAGGGFALPASSPSVYRAIAVGTEHTCAIQQIGGTGGLDCWGGNGASTLAPRDNPAYTALLSSSQPLAMRPIHPLLNRTNGAVDAVAADELMTCAKLSSDEVVCWGGENQLNPDNPQLLPPVIRDATDGIVFSDGLVSNPGLAVSTRPCSNLRCTNICAISNPGMLACGNWGSGGRPTLATVPGAPANVHFVQVDTGPNHTCAVSSHGDIYCVGSNEFGQLGDGTTTNRATLVKALGLPEPPATIKLPPLHRCPPWCN